MSQKMADNQTFINKVIIPVTYISPILKEKNQYRKQIIAY